MKKILLAASLAVFLSSGFALADQAATDTAMNGKAAKSAAMQEFTRLDTNKDGFIERSEARSNAALEKDFTRISSSEKVSRKAFVAWQSHQGGKHPVVTKRNLTTPAEKPAAPHGYNQYRIRRTVPCAARLR